MQWLLTEQRGAADVDAFAGARRLAKAGIVEGQVRSATACMLAGR
jgi:hypothetical protein